MWVVSRESSLLPLFVECGLCYRKNLHYAPRPHHLLLEKLTETQGIPRRKGIYLPRDLSSQELYSKDKLHSFNLENHIFFKKSNARIDMYLWLPRDPALMSQRKGAGVWEALPRWTLLFASLHLSRQWSR